MEDLGLGARIFGGRKETKNQQLGSA